MKDHITFTLTKSQSEKMHPLCEACYKTKGQNLIMGDAHLAYNLTGKHHEIKVNFGLFSEKDGRKITKHSKGKQIKF